jgi:magnesium-transporting ATPase (P-type)
MAAIRDMLAPHTSVLRDGARLTVDGADLVPGDIVLLEAGDKVPADLRLIEARSLSAQEAILTGESVPVEKTVPPMAADAPLGDHRSMLWSGTLVTQGTAKGLVVDTGGAKAAGKDVHAVYFEKEGHGYTRWQTDVQRARILEDFLARTLGGRTGNFDLAETAAKYLD